MYHSECTPLGVTLRFFNNIYFDHLLIDKGVAEWPVVVSSDRWWSIDVVYCCTDK